MNNVSRKIEWLKEDWKFCKGDIEGAETHTFDDSSWENVRVPHDWSISGPFDRENDLQVIRILEDGQTEDQGHTGRTGGLPHVGKGWYRKQFIIPQEDSDKRFRIEFDGVMSHSKVYVNGQFAGTWPYGYNSFAFDITDLVKIGEKNILAVSIDNKPMASRWYPGAGIYRNVRLVTLVPVNVAHWGTYVTIPEINDDAAAVNLKTEIENHSGKHREIELISEIFNPEGIPVSGNTLTVSIDKTRTVSQDFKLNDITLWDIENPQLYKVVSRICIDGKPADVYETRFGLRKVHFDLEKGFFLNDRHLKLNGVCNHHDLGPLGTAVNRRALERQLKLLKEMGCNSIRTSHNPPAPELLDLCDEMGFLVIDEIFDEWKKGKVDNGYHILFDEWADKDLTATIRRDRNHPCVFMWSIGNEVAEQGIEGGGEVAKFLHAICKREDPTRPTTSGFCAPDGAIENGLAEAVDIPGWNYKPHFYGRYHREHPQWIAYGSETESTLSTRGEYILPVKEEYLPVYDNLQVPSYDLSYPGWGYPPDVEFQAQEACPFILGEYVWTGFDYLGEPTPYYCQWPSRSSYFGIIDLCGIPKDRYYSYQAQWTDKEVLHIFPHWNWGGHEGEIIPIHCYTNYQSAELFVNDKSYGVVSKRPCSANVLKHYRLIWENVVYEPGILKIVVKDKDGNIRVEKSVKTAGSPAKIELTPDRQTIKADGDDLSFITIAIQDADMNLCPLADNLVKFTVEGPAEIAGVGNGDQTSIENFQADKRKAFHGYCMLIVRSLKGQSGNVKILAESEGLTTAETQITCD